MFSSVVGGLCALKGPLHGGAPGPVLDMLDAIGTEKNIRPWLTDALARGERLMGFGHRIYRVRDPRADVLKGAVSRLKEGSERIGFAGKVEAVALELLKEKKPLRPLQTNVEFYTALVLEAVGFPRESFTNVFAAGRWQAGPPMCWSRNRPAASFARNRVTSGKGRGASRLPPSSWI